MTAEPPLLRLVVYGTPGTAGSKSAFPLWRNNPDGSRQFVRTLQVEKDVRKVKANWRTAIMAAAADAIIDPTTERIRSPFPLVDEPLVGRLVFTVRKPASAPKTSRSWPIAKPDSLKYARAAEDALMAAGVLKDDSRVVEYSRIAKVFPGEDPEALDVPGAVICLWRLQDLIIWQREALVAEPAGTLFDPIQQL